MGRPTTVPPSSAAPGRRRRKGCSSGTVLSTGHVLYPRTVRCREYIDTFCPTKCEASSKRNHCVTVDVLTVLYSVLYCTYSTDGVPHIMADWSVGAVAERHATITGGRLHPRPQEDSVGIPREGKASVIPSGTVQYQTVPDSTRQYRTSGRRSRDSFLLIRMPSRHRSPRTDGRWSAHVFIHVFIHDVRWHRRGGKARKAMPWTGRRCVPLTPLRHVARLGMAVTALRGVVVVPGGEGIVAAHPKDMRYAHNRQEKPASHLSVSCNLLVL